jgi:hypothetical protein
MLRFQRHDRRPRNYLARREQYRLFALVVGLGVVLLLMRQLAPSDSAPGSAGGLPSGTAVAPVEPPAEPGASVVVDRERLADVEDNSHFRNEETNAWFYLFSLVGAARGQSAENVTYTQLVAQPHVYRGKFVQVEGTVKRVEAVTPAENDLGITELYRVILQSAGRSVWPVIVYCRELPQGWKVGEPGSNRVVATGYFFKNLSYNSPAGMGLAPVIVSQTFDVQELQPAAPAAEEKPVSIGTIVVSAVAIAAVFVAFVLWRTSESKTNREDAAQVGEALRKLARGGE